MFRSFWLLLVTFVNQLTNRFMKAQLPVYCRILGYVVLLFSIFAPFALFIAGAVTDHNLLLYKEIFKLLMIVGLLMILLARTRNENADTEFIRIKAMRSGFFLTILFLFGNMVYKLYDPSSSFAESSSFIIFMVMNVLCLEYGIKKAKAENLFRK